MMKSLCTAAFVAAALLCAIPASATQKLASLNADAHPLDFGTAIVFDAAGMHAAGRADNPNYRGPIFGGLTAADVTVSDVADNYAIPAGPPVAAPPTHAVLAVTDFKKRFTFAERVALLSSTDAGVKVFLDELNTASVVHLDDADTIAGMNYIVSLGLLTAGRRDAILSAP